MSVKFEELEHNLVKLTVEIPEETIEKAENEVYLRERSRITVPGFRKGKAPRQIIEKTYGKGVFFEDAVNDAIPVAYEDAVSEVEKEQNITVASYPEIEYTQVEIGKPVIFAATVAKKPEVKLGNYKGLKVEAPSAEVTDEDVDAAIAEQAEKNATYNPVEDRAVQDGDMVTLDFLGKVDGVAFPGGEGTDYQLGIGSHSFIDGFEEQLIGMNCGETRDIDVKFPEEYHEASLAGKPATFTCTIKAIKAKEIPAIDDEFAAEVSDFETLAEYKEDMKKKLAERKEADAKRAKEDALVAEVVKASEMDIPELMITSEARMAVNDFAQRLQSQGLSLAQYMQYTGQTEQDMIDGQKEQAQKAIESRLVLEAIAAAEAIEATDEDVEAKLTKMAEQYGLELAQIKEFTSEDQIDMMKKDIVTEKALDVVYASAK